MPEIRIDPLSGHRTIVAGERSRRPGGEPGGHIREAPPDPIDPERDPFADGHEDRTPPELYAVRPAGGPRFSRLDGARDPQPVPRAHACRPG
jgi:UDPglucose--hexose-1-phosphate uridylyltransferase